MLYMAHLIRVKNNIKDFPYDEVNQVTPWPTLRHEPGQSWAEISKKMNSTVLSDGKNLKDKWDNPKYPFRVFKSHGASRQCCPICTFCCNAEQMDANGHKYLPSRHISSHTHFCCAEVPDDSNAGRGSVLPVRRRRDVKFLATVRNPFDQIRSVYPFFGSHEPAFRRMWGGFPPVYTSKKQCLDDVTDGGVLEHLVWGWVKTWFMYKDDPNVLVFNYDQMLKDPSSSHPNIHDTRTTKHARQLPTPPPVLASFISVHLLLLKLILFTSPLGE